MNNLYVTGTSLIAGGGGTNSPVFPFEVRTIATDSNEKRIGFNPSGSQLNYNPISQEGDSEIIFLNQTVRNPPIGPNTGGLVIAPWANSVSGGLPSGIRIDGNGNVGVGTSNADYRLNVNGSMFSESLIVGGGTATSESFAFKVTTNDSIIGVNDSKQLGINPSASTGAWNPIVQNGDTEIIFSNGPYSYPGSTAVPTTGGLVLANWSGAYGGIRIDGNGNVGVGTSNADYRLNVNGSMFSESLKVSNNTSEVYTGITDFPINSAINDNNPGIQFKNGSTGYGIMGYTDTLHLLSSNEIRFSTNNPTLNGATTEQMRIQSNGDVTVQNSISASSFITTSDYRTKGHINPLEVTNKLDNLHPVEYIRTTTNQKELGFIAHELQEVYPELVSGEKDGEKMQAVNYQGLISVLVKEVQELRKRVSLLEEKTMKK